MKQRRALQQMKTSSCSSNSSYGDEDCTSGFIDMEVTSTTSSPKFHYSASTPIQSREFEFQMITNVTHEMDSTTSYPADELFYKGKLLPLHLPPRLKLVEKLVLHNVNADITDQNASKTDAKLIKNTQQEFRNHLFGSTTAPCTNSNTPFDISQSESCRASTELNLDEYFFDWSKEITSLVVKDTRLHRKNSWSRKIKHSSLGKKLEASRTYLKSLFNKSCGKSTSNSDDQQGGGGCVLKAKECMNKYNKVSSNKEKPFGLLQHEKFNISSLLIKNSKELVENGQTRKSFSGAIKWTNAATTSTANSNTLGSSSSSSSSSSSFSFNFNGVYELQLLKRSSSEGDSSVDGAIAYCKQSQKMQCS